MLFFIAPMPYPRPAQRGHYCGRESDLAVDKAEELTPATEVDRVARHGAGLICRLENSVKIRLIAVGRL